MIETLFTTEFLSLLGSSAVGFIFKNMAEKREMQRQLFEQVITKTKRYDDSANQAIQRVSHDAGKIVRRIIVMTILFGTFVAPFILPFFNIPTVVEFQYETEPFLGLFGGGKEVVLYNVHGYLFTEENRQILITIVGFYFGMAAGKVRSGR